MLNILKQACDYSPSAWLDTQADMVAPVVYWRWFTVVTNSIFGQEGLDMLFMLRTTSMLVISGSSPSIAFITILRSTTAAWSLHYWPSTVFQDISYFSSLGRCHLLRRRRPTLEHLITAITYFAVIIRPFRPDRWAFISLYVARRYRFSDTVGSAFSWAPSTGPPHGAIVDRLTIKVISRPVEHRFRFSCSRLWRRRLYSMNTRRARSPLAGCIFGFRPSLDFLAAPSPSLSSLAAIT